MTPMNGKSEFSNHNYIEYQPGSLNVIIVAPHGGKIKPSHVPDRDAGAIVNGKVVYSHQIPRSERDFQRAGVRFKRDNYTLELSLLLAERLYDLTGQRPHVIINNLHRSKMDGNSEQEKATFGHPDMDSAWTAFHNFIHTAKAAIKGRGLLLDIHGQSHTEDWVELGYTLTDDQLDKKSYTAAESSVYNLALMNGATGKTDFEALVCGGESLGGLLALEGYTVVPSPLHPGPAGGNYYTGGYNTQHHGSRAGNGHIDAIQIESPKSLRKKDSAPEYASALARVLHKYLLLYYSNANL